MGPLLGQARLWPNCALFCSLQVRLFQFLFELVMQSDFVGSALVIPPLLTIEVQMCAICDLWGIKYLNLSSINESSIGDCLKTEKPQVLIASIEKISDTHVQKQLSSLKLEYISVDEAQVNSTF